MTYVNALVAGLVVGGAYSLLAVGVSLIFSTTGVLNFAHAGFAMVAAYVYAWLATDQGWNHWVAALAAVAVVAVVGVVAERLVIRRVMQSSAVTRLMATVGLLALLQGLILQIFGFEPRVAPSLFSDRPLRLGSFSITTQQVAVFVAAVVLAGGLALVLRYTRTGLAVRAVASNPVAASLMGIRLTQVSRLNWAIAATLAGVAGVLIAPLTLVSVVTFPIFLIKALAATLFGAVAGLLGAFLGGFLIGGAEGLGSALSSAPGIRELVVFGVVVAVLVLRRRWPRELVSEDVVPVGRRTFRFAREARWLVAAAAAVALFNAVRSDYWAYVGALALVYALAGLSLVVLTGWAGQISLMNGSLVGVGAFGLTFFLSRVGLSFWAAALCAVAAGAAVSSAVAPMTARIRGLQVGIVTLAVSGALSQWLFQVRGTSVLVQRPDWLSSDRHVFYALLATTVVLYVVAARLRASAWGRMLLAVRQSTDMAAHFGISPLAARLVAFSLSGAIAASAGVLYAVLLTALKPADFGALFSITVLLYIVVCGSESLAGPLLVALIFGIGPQVIKVSQASASAIADIASGLLLVVLITARPGGLATLLNRSRVGADQESGSQPRVALAPEPAGRRLARREGARLAREVGSNVSSVAP